jgi:hypothetical protein
MGKKVKKHLLRGALALMLCQLLIALGSSSAFAATPAPSTNNSTNTLKISPVRTDVTVQPGTSAKVTTFVTNLTKTPIQVHPIENDFVAGDEKGTPSIILDENSYAPTHSLKRFMVPLQNVQIAPGETKQIDVTVTVPKSAQAGGYFGAIRFAPASPDGSKSVNLSTSVASLILLTVPGPTTEQLNLTNFEVQQDGSSSGNFRTPEDLSLLLRFQNKGNIQEAPFGQIYVQKGKKVVYTNNFNQNDPKDTILPDSARKWNVPLKGFGKFGKYKVGATITYGNTSKSITVSKTVWIIPTTYIIGLIVGILLLILIIVGIWLALKAYKRRILRGSGYQRRR